MGDAVSIGDAKTNLSRLVARAEAGEEIVLRRGPTAVAKIVRYEVGPPRRPGALRDVITIGPDFDDPLEEFAPYRP